jgi:hypothetical protein
MTYKPKLLERLQRGHADALALVDTLGAAERNRPGTYQRWSAKDVIAHVTAWQGRLLEILAALERGDTPPDFWDELDELNRATYEATRERTWDDVLADFERVFETLVAHVERLDERRLTDKGYYATKGGRLLWSVINGNSFAHLETHLSGYYAQHHDLARANAIQEMLAGAQAALDDTPVARGTALYNLACHYALTGQAAPALARLREALPLNPDLVAWSRQDEDLVSLHGTPEYEALFAA